jgi:hypothetical protein
MSGIAAYGLGVDTPAGWEGRIFRRVQTGEVRAAEAPGPPAPMGEHTFPLVQVATVPLPADAADFGSDVVSELGPNDALVVLKEFDPREATQPLFAGGGMPRSLAVGDFSPATLQRRLDGQAGFQAFFREAGRAFCLYVVLGGDSNRAAVVPRVNGILSTMKIDPLAPPPAGP